MNGGSKGMIRAFVGLPLPTEYQERLDKLRREWMPRFHEHGAKPGWTRKGNWHVTLKFLGDVGPNTVEDLKRALAKVAFAPFRFQAGGAGFFPEPGQGKVANPRVLWVGLEQGTRDVAGLAGQVQGALEPLGFERETRPFRPHLTLARIKEPARDRSGAIWEEWRQAMRKETWPELTMNEMVLWRSVLGPDGPTYTALAGFPAKGE